ncbi:MAG: cysteine hydrolase [Anaerolineales bacterium]|nr:cysteine hydrolase [Anaerolineales bacterium]
MNKISISCLGDRVFEFSPETTALLSIDFQKEFFVDGMGECLDEMRSIIPRVAKLISLARTIQCKVIHTRESYQPDLSDVSEYRRSLSYVGKPGPMGRFCVLGEPGHEFVEAAKPIHDETVIDKASFGAFHNTDLDEILKRDGIDHLIICGVTTQCCVHSTLREAVDRGYWCLTVADCCAALEPGLHDAALSLISGEGHLFGWIADVQDVANGVSSFKFV